MKHWMMGMVVIGLATGSALGAHGYRGYGTRGGYRQTMPAYSPGFFSYEAERIKARHSRDRYQTHPRSYYNAPQRGIKYYPGGYGYYGRATRYYGGANRYYGRGFGGYRGYGGW